MIKGQVTGLGKTEHTKKSEEVTQKKYADPGFWMMLQKLNVKLEALKGKNIAERSGSGELANSVGNHVL